jgi:VanZ family protein
VRKLAALAFFIFLLAVAYWADSGTMPAPLKFVSAVPNGDRLGHFVLYGILAYLVSAAFPSRWVRVRAWRLPLGAVLAAAMATLEEISQIFIPARTPDLVDLAAGYLGILVATLIFNRQFAPKSPGTGEGTSAADPP